MQNVFTALLLFIALAAGAQTACIKGTVWYKTTGETAPFVTVYLESTKNGMHTNIDGEFTLCRLEPGKYTVIAVSLGYDTIRKPVTLKPGDTILLKLDLKESEITLDDLELRVYQEPLIDPDTNSPTIKRKELNEIPFSGKADDIMFITPNPHFEKNITTIDVLPQAGAYRINFPEP